MGSLRICNCQQYKRFQCYHGLQQWVHFAEPSTIPSHSGLPSPILIQNGASRQIFVRRPQYRIQPTCGRTDMTELITPYKNALNAEHEHPIRLSPRPAAHSDVPCLQLNATKRAGRRNSTYFFLPLLGLFHAFCRLKLWALS